MNIYIFYNKDIFLSAKKKANFVFNVIGYIEEKTTIILETTKRQGQMLYLSQSMEDLIFKNVI